MANIINIPDGSTDWGDALRTNLNSLNSEVGTANIKANAAINMASTRVRSVNGIYPDDTGDVEIVVQSIDQTARDAAAAAQSSADSKYTKPVNGISLADLASTIQTSLGKADSSVQTTRQVLSGTGLTGGGSLSSDVTLSLTSAVQTSLGKADSAVQPATLSSYIKTVNNTGPDANGNVTVTASGGGYIKPANGIPKADLDPSVQSSLTKADSALQSAPVTTVAGRAGDVTLTKSDVGLTNVDNTADVNKPLSSAQQTYVDARTPNGLRGTASQRDSFYGTTNVPVGSYWFNTDMQWEERYYAAYTGAGNVDISRPAGWYPVAGRLPSVEADNNAVAQSITSATTTVLALSRVSMDGGFTSTARGDGIGFVAPVTGRYAFYVTGTFASGTGTREVSVRVNGSTYGTGSMSIATATNPTLTAAVPTLEVAAGAVIDFRIYQTAATITFTVIRAGIVYLGPI